MVKTYSGHDYYYACGYPYGEWIKIWGVGYTAKTAIQAAKEAIRNVVAQNPDSCWVGVYSDLRVFEIEADVYYEFRRGKTDLPREYPLEDMGVRAMHIDGVGL